MTFVDGEGAEDEVLLPDDFVIPTPVKEPLFSRKRKPAGDKADAGEKKAKPAVRIPNRKGQFVEPLTALYMSAGAIMLPIDPICGNAIIQVAEECANAWDELAQKNDAVRKFLWGITQTSLTTKLFFAHMPLFMAVFMHHSPFAQKKMSEMGQSMAETIANQMRANGATPPENPSDE